MAFRYYALNRGQTEFQVTEGAGTSGDDIEIRINASVAMTMAEIQQAMTMLGQWILKNGSKALIP